MAHGYHLEAEYESGYVLREDDNDHSPYDKGKNVFHAILNARPVPVHGKLVRYSLVGPEHTHSVDWTAVPDNARPIYFRKMESDSVGGIVTEVRVIKQTFGYQYLNNEGRSVKVVQEI